MVLVSRWNAPCQDCPQGRLVSEGLLPQRICDVAWVLARSIIFRCVIFFIFCVWLLHDAHRHKPQTDNLYSSGALRHEQETSQKGKGRTQSESFDLRFVACCEHRKRISVENLQTPEKPSNPGDIGHSHFPVSMSVCQGVKEPRPLPNTLQAGSRGLQNPWGLVVFSVGCFDLG